MTATDVRYCHDEECQTPTCPTTAVQPDGTPHTIIGCGSSNVRQDPNEPTVFDCLDCGIWFNPDLEA